MTKYRFTYEKDPSIAAIPHHFTIPLTDNSLKRDF